MAKSSTRHVIRNSLLGIVLIAITAATIFFANVYISEKTSTRSKAAGDPLLSQAKPLYELVRTIQTDIFLYTISEKDRDEAQTIHKFKLTKPIALIFPLKVNNTVPLHRLIAANSAYYYTANDEEKDAAVAIRNYTYEGILGFIYLEQEPSTIPLYRLRKGNSYRLTADKTRAEQLKKNGFVEQRTIGYVYPTDTDTALSKNTFPITSEVWFAPTNTGAYGKLEPGFLNIFNQEETWPNAREKIQVMQFFLGSLMTQYPTFAQVQETVIPKIKEWGLKVAFEVTGATVACNTPRQQFAIKEIDYMKKFAAAGVPVSYIVMDSALVDKILHNCTYDPYNPQENITDMVRYAKLVKEAFPNAQIGFTESLPVRGMDAFSKNSFSKDLDALLQAFSENNLTLHFVHYDNAYDFRNPSQNKPKFDRLAKAVKLAKDKGIDTGIIFNSESGLFDQKQNAIDTIKMRNELLTKRKVTLDDVIIESWTRYPPTIPEDEEGTLSNIVLRFFEK